MRKGRASLTSRGVMFWRATATNSPYTRLFSDPVAERLLTPLGRFIVKSRLYHRLVLRALKRSRFLRVMVSVLFRARYAEDKLVEAIAERGVRQYVILGAGWDSFAWRREDLLPKLKVFELDHPDTQRAKRQRLSELNLATPPNLTFVAIDFNTQSLTECLLTNGFDPAVPTYVNWMGVTYYLPLPVVTGVFQELATLCRGGVEVAFDYVDVRRNKRRNQKTTDERPHRYWLEKVLHFGGEQFYTDFDPDKLAAWFAALDYRLVENVLGRQQRDFLPAEEFGEFIPKGLLHVARVQHKAA